MNAIDLLKDDHREVKRLFSEILEAEDSEAGQRREIFRQIERELLQHRIVEEQVLYPAIESLDPEGVREGRHSHEEMEQILSQLRVADIDGETFDHDLMKLMERVQQHAQLEEAPGGILEAARRKLNAGHFQTMSDRILEMKRCR
jgi:hemerythrin superfamily protein